MGELGSGILSTFLSLAWLVHVDLSLGVLVDTKTHGVPIKIVNRVEVLEEGVSDEEEILVLSWKSALVDNEVTLFVG